jgi:hypothetical protein
MSDKKRPDKKRWPRSARSWVLTVAAGLVMTVLATLDAVASTPWWVVAAAFAVPVLWVVGWLLLDWDPGLDREVRAAWGRDAHGRTWEQRVAIYRAAHGLRPLPVHGQITVDRQAIEPASARRRATERWRAVRRRGE